MGGTTRESCACCIAPIGGAAHTLATGCSKQVPEPAPLRAARPSAVHDAADLIGCHLKQRAGVGGNSRCKCINSLAAEQICSRDHGEAQIENRGSSDPFATELWLATFSSAGHITFASQHVQRYSRRCSTGL